MYQYTAFDQEFVRRRAEQFRDQLERWQRGELSDEQLLPLRLQNGWYIQRYAPMARIAVPYGEISSVQLRMLARIAREYDRPDPALLAHAQATQDALQAAQPGLALSAAAALRLRPLHHAHQLPVQLDSLVKAPDVMDLLASVHMHGIQTSGNASATSPATPGRHCRGRHRRLPPVCRDPRQWSTLHPEFAFLPRKFKIAFNGAEEDRAATGWYDIGLQARKNAAAKWASRCWWAAAWAARRSSARWCASSCPGPAAELHRGHRARVQQLWPARQQVEGAHQDPGQGEGQGFIDAVEKEFRPSSSWTARRTPSPRRSSSAWPATSWCRRWCPPTSPARSIRRASCISAGSSKTCAATGWPA
jgi:hypothetical protein